METGKHFEIDFNEGMFREERELSAYARRALQDIVDKVVDRERN
jgi:hypothetical protein